MKLLMAQSKDGGKRKDDVRDKEVEAGQKGITLELAYTKAGDYYIPDLTAY